MRRRQTYWRLRRKANDNLQRRNRRMCLIFNKTTWTDQDVTQILAVYLFLTLCEAMLYFCAWHLQTKVYHHFKFVKYCCEILFCWSGYMGTLGKRIWPALCYTHYVPHGTPFGIVEVDGVSLCCAGLDWTWIQWFIISLYPSFYHLLLNPFHLGEITFITSSAQIFC